MSLKFDPVSLQAYLIYSSSVAAGAQSGIEECKYQFAWDAGTALRRPTAGCQPWWPCGGKGKLQPQVPGHSLIRAPLSGTEPSLLFPFVGLWSQVISLSSIFSVLLQLLFFLMTPSLLNKWPLPHPQSYTICSLLASSKYK